MQTLTEIVAAVVVHSSAAAYAHLGMPVEVHQIEKPAPVERTVARTAPKKDLKVSDCPQPQPRARVVKT